MSLIRKVALGIDASLTHTGVAIIALDDGTHMEWTCVPKTKGTARLYDIERWFKALVEDTMPERGFQVGIVTIEGYAFTPMAGQAFSLGELGGVLKLFFWKYGHDLISVAPTTLKKWVTGEGRGDKNMILLKAFKKWNVEFTNDHCCDAFGLAKIGQALVDIQSGVKDIKSYFDYEQEVLKLLIKRQKEMRNAGKEKEGKRKRKASPGKEADASAGAGEATGTGNA